MSQYEAEARKVVQKLCGQGKCHYSFNCDHSNHDPKWPKIGSETVCPLAKYHIQPETNPKPWYERPASETSVELEDIFYVCANCEHATVVEEDGYLVAKRTNLEKFCLDCPAKGAEESIQECMAES